MSTKHIGYETGRTEIGDIDRAETFGRLIGITRPILAFYCSDLYHDARWIHDNVTGPDVTFYFGVRESGTSIGFDHALVKAYNVAVYRIRVWVDNGDSSVSVDSIFPA
jgi:hypothetical protein